MASPTLSPEEIAARFVQEWGDIGMLLHAQLREACGNPADRAAVWGETARILDGIPLDFEIARSRRVLPRQAMIALRTAVASLALRTALQAFVIKYGAPARGAISRSDDRSERWG